MAKSKKNSIRKQLTFIDLFKKETSFLVFVLTLFVIASLVYNIPHIAMWFGFAIATYSVISNDSIQTIGTFIASNTQRKWWVMWLYIGGLFVVVLSLSYFLFDGDVSFQRLSTKGFDENPTQFEYLQLAAPIFLIILTRMRMPVSTTFLLLSSFAAGSGAIGKVLMKSMGGYVIAFVVAIVIFLILSKYLKRIFVGKPKRTWTVIQWITSGALWSLWVMQDAANVVIFLPRKLEFTQFLAVVCIAYIGLGFLFYHRGGRIQRIVTSKSDVKDVRPATVVDFVYAMLMMFHLLYSTVPMSTTWIFLGLLGGREVAMSITKTGSRKFSKSLLMIGRDLGMALIGLFISIFIAFAVNSTIRTEVYGWFF
ncbi:MAG: hypothetical protein RBS19_11095 [Bacteroidales bacterium]|nr:hypothetical protein [Bacteroidales bacterium]MDY0217488.1 hypothetical protein [Bacteroidales bacterium]